MNKLKRLLIILCVSSFFLIPFFYKVRIECRSQIGQCPKEIYAKLESSNNKSLFRVRREVASALSSDYTINDYSTQLRLPNIYSIYIIVKRPAFSILDRSTGKYLMCDSQGRVLSVADGSNTLVIIKDTVSEKVGDYVNATDVFASKVIKGVNSLYQVGTGTIQNDTLVVDLPGEIRVIFPVEGQDVDILLGSLRLIYTKLTTNYLGIYSQIDLRYKNPILR